MDGIFTSPPDDVRTRARALFLRPDIDMYTRTEIHAATTTAAAGQAWTDDENPW